MSGTDSDTAIYTGAVATLVTFHAHPDDEASQTAGLMAKAAAAGHRVVLITATDGAEGEIHTQLDAGETLADRRHREVARSAEILGAELIWLGYPDSGMAGEPANERLDCFWQTDVEVIAAKVAAMLHEVGADVIVVYDDHGGYGHPDHIQVHRAGLRAAEIAGLDHVYEVTMNRDRVMEALTHAPELEGMERPSPEEFATVGTSDADISYVIDAREFALRKREALIAHASQMPPESFFMKMPEEMFIEAFGFEFYNLPGVTDTGGPTLVDLLPGL